VRKWLCTLHEGGIAVAYPKDYSGATRHCMLMYRPLSSGPVLMWDPSNAIEKDARLAVQNRTNETSLRIHEYVAVRLLRFDGLFKKRQRMGRNMRRKRSKHRASVNANL
jgi:hypothetical protein